MARYIKCPRCRSKNLYIIEDNRFNADAALGGWLFTKSIFGASMYGRSVKSVFECADCGKVFKKHW
ncbi:MAG: hypothetical protein IJY09_10780 [Lachnospiraceae bacterium]|nr:hypothetical protein [Lachnospiraceae bacterium]